MDARTLVTGSADVVTVLTLRKNDVYKRIEKDYSGWTLRFGVVTDVMHNGEDAAITAIEFSANYSGVEPTLKLFGTDTDMRLFAATPEEFGEHFTEVVKAAERAVSDAEKTLDTKRQIAATVAATFTEDVLASLTAAETSTVAELTA